MKYTRLACLLALSMWFTLPAYAQDNGNEQEEKEVSDEYKDAQELYEARQFAFAAEMFQEAYSETRDSEEKAEIAFKLGECYRWMRDYRKAESQYRRAERLEYGPIAILRQAEVLMGQGEYEDAIEMYQNYQEAAPGDPRGEAGVRAARNAREWMDNPQTRYQVTNLGKDYNSREPDFGPRYAGRRGRETDVLFFSSQREEATGRDEDGWTNFNFADIFKIERERRAGRPNSDVSVSWSTPVQIDGEDEIINTPDHEAGVALDSRGTMYFTRCMNVKRAYLGCAIWTTRVTGNNFMAPEPAVIAPDSTYSVGHPALSLDEETLYFAGNLPGATDGSRDLWMTTFNRRERRWNTPTNLGSLVNTSGEELWPYIHDDGYLYFASDGHPGMGGLDIFRVKLGEDGMPEGEVENLMWPINSPGDDYAIVFEPGGTAEVGFMTSTYEERDDHRGAADIYNVYLVPLRYTISGLVTSTKDRSPVSQVTVTLSGGPAPITVNTDNDGYYTFTMDQLSPDMQYTISYEKKKFFAGEASTTTIGVPLSAHEKVEDPDGDYFIHNITLNVGMEPIDVPIILPNVLFETAKWDLNESSQRALDTVVAILQRNPNITIELRSHTDYTDTEERNKILSQHRADTCVSYLISKGIAAERLTAVGRGEEEPNTIPENYDGLYSDDFEDGQELTESWIKRQPQALQEKANQLNRRTDMKVLRDDYVPSNATAGGGDAEGEGGGEAVPEGPTVGVLHEVQRRENIGRIASQYDINVRQLKELNGGLRGVRLQEGMLLKVTPGGDYTEFDRTHYQVERGETFDDIADKLDMDEDTLEELNPDLDGDRLPAGMYIKIQ